MKFSTTFAIPLLFAGLPVAAQAPQVQPLQMVPRPTPDADALGAAMRRIGSNPRDLSSLIEAGELSLKLGDATAAASLFKRAEQVDPMNGRVKAGMARILVQQERPGEALRFFDQAAGYGLDARSFAGDRGLAYDLIGEQTRAQRDYLLALAAGPQEEVQRRYALSLAISGKQADALKQIDPLVRASDRGAWRTRAFILAMGGDLAGATDIATRMMPPGMATGLQPFFRALPALGPVDRAFAVHFGEVRATPARLADARLAPALPALPAEPAAAPVTLAQAAAPVLRAEVKTRDRRRSSRDRRRAGEQRLQVTRAAPPPAAVLPEAPRYGSYNGVTFAAPREVAQAVPTQPTPAPVAAPTTATQVAAATPQVPPAAPAQVASAVTAAPRPVVPQTPPATTGTSTGSPAARVVAQTPPVAAVPQSVTAAVAPAPQSVASPAVVALAQPSTVVPSTAASTPPPTATASTAAVGPAVTTAATPPPARAVAAASAPVAPQMSEDSILARIIAGISIPAEELGVAPARPATPAPAQPVATAPVQLASAAPVARPVAPVAPVAKPVPAPTPKPTPAVDPKVAARKAAADKKAAEAKKLAAAEKAAAAKKLADEKKAEKADPARIWVQVAGGANASDLAKAWGAAKSKAAALSGKTAYSTPLRATNRVVTGPFKTDAEAQAMVNTLAKQGVSAFTFTSEAGQRVTRLSTK